jgi:signal transduction histidine kinase
MESSLEQVLLDKALAQEKYQIASNILHDIGNAVIGLSSYVTRVKRSLEHDNSENLQNLAGFFKLQQEAIAIAIGTSKADAIIKLVSGIAQTQKANQQDINNSSLELQKIITHIQEILNIQRQYISGPDAIEKKEISLKGLINDCISMLLASYKKRGIIISIDMPDNLPQFNGDRTKIMQVILNVLKNSIEAIDIYTMDRYVSLSATTNCASLILKIHDSGKGFDEETGKKIFTRGFTTKKTGTGLGLDHCKAILEAHNGSIAITSEGPGKGAITTIKFPLEKVLLNNKENLSL